VDQDQLNPYVANEGYVVRVPHNSQLAYLLKHSPKVKSKSTKLKLYAHGVHCQKAISASPKAIIGISSTMILFKHYCYQSQLTMLDF
jgi:hypothetical protein